MCLQLPLQILEAWDALRRGPRQAARPNSEATRLADPADERDELSAARGVVNGVVLGATLWSLIGLLVWCVA
jgi:hypothetical protein